MITLNAPHLWLKSQEELLEYLWEIGPRCSKYSFRNITTLNLSHNNFYSFNYEYLAKKIAREAKLTAFICRKPDLSEGVQNFLGLLSMSQVKSLRVIDLFKCKIEHPDTSTMMAHYLEAHKDLEILHLPDRLLTTCSLSKMSAVQFRRYFCHKKLQALSLNDNPLSVVFQAKLIVYLKNLDQLIYLSIGSSYEWYSQLKTIAKKTFSEFSKMEFLVITGSEDLDEKQPLINVLKAISSLPSPELLYQLTITNFQCSREI